MDTVELLTGAQVWQRGAAAMSAPQHLVRRDGAARRAAASTGAVADDHDDLRWRVACCEHPFDSRRCSECSELKAAVLRRLVRVGRGTQPERRVLCSTGALLSAPASAANSNC